MFNSGSLIKTTRLNTLFKNTLLHADKNNQVWEVNLNTETLWNGQGMKFITIVESYSQNVLAIEAIELQGATEMQLVNMLERLRRSRSMPASLVYDHSMFISTSLDIWCNANAVKQMYVYFGHSKPNLFLKQLIRRRNIKIIPAYNGRRYNCQ